MTLANPGAEWLEADGLGGYAMGRADGVRTRRYHSLLTVATRPPTGRTVLVNGFDAWLDVGGERVAISSQRYTPDVTAPDGATRLTAFTHVPWPTWTYALSSGLQIVQELIMSRDVTSTDAGALVALSWSVRGDADDALRLTVRPFLSGRDAHGEHHENAAFSFDAHVDGETVAWQPYESLPFIVARANGDYAHEPSWYRNFQYDEERARGLDFVEDLASPGTFTFELGSGRAVLVLAASPTGVFPSGTTSAADAWARIEHDERARRDAFRSPLHRAADAYVVKRGDGRTIVAGYPWFSDWGRDTFIAVRGLCIAGDRLADARDVLLEWSRHVSEGMLPNYFPDGDEPAQYNSVDASLWYCVAVHDLLHAAGSTGVVADAQRDAMMDAVEAIVAGYARGTRFRIAADGTGLLAAGEPGVQLTWMDAKVGDWVVTPRVGKPVEIQALWINALRVAGTRARRWSALADHAQASFAELFWDEVGGGLMDVIDVDHVRGTFDALCRPNQILAVGGLPWPLLGGERARRVVDTVESRLWTPAGLRTLARGEPGYVDHYRGDARARDSAYHQGTVWPWLLGAFVDAWVRVRDPASAEVTLADVRREARERFLAPLLAHYASAAPGHVCEVADAEPPHAPGGCPFQAWSVGEALRLAESILRIDDGDAVDSGSAAGSLGSLGTTGNTASVTHAASS